MRAAVSFQCSVWISCAIRETVLFLFQKTIYFSGQFQEPFRVLFDGCLLAQNLPALFCRSLHPIPLPVASVLRWPASLPGSGLFQTCASSACSNCAAPSSLPITQRMPARSASASSVDVLKSVNITMGRDGFLSRIFFAAESPSMGCML